MTAAIPDDVREAAWRALESNKTRGDAIGVLIAAILDERERGEVLVNQVRAVITEWNFGPLGDTEALVSIWKLVGDNIQGGPNQPPTGE